MQWYIAEIGWLHDSKFKGVVLSEEAIRLTLAALNDAPLFDGPYFSIDTHEMRKRNTIGRVEVDGATIYCYTDHDLTGKYPALDLKAIAKATDGGLLATSVKEAALFITDEDNGNTFYRVEDAPDA